jgi:hypothetical protein
MGADIRHDSALPGARSHAAARDASASAAHAAYTINLRRRGRVRTLAAAQLTDSPHMGGKNSSSGELLRRCPAKAPVLHLRALVLHDMFRFRRSFHL